jgi:hypothetical protein
MYCGVNGLQRGLKSLELKVGSDPWDRIQGGIPDSKDSVRITERWAGDAR